MSENVGIGPKTKISLGVLGVVIVGAVSVVSVLITLHVQLRSGYRGEGASAEQAKECCDKIHKLEEEQRVHNESSEGWKQRVIEIEKKNDWQDRRIEAGDARSSEIREMMGEIRGQLNEILRRTGQGPVKPSTQRIGSRRSDSYYFSRPSTDSIRELIEGLQEGGP